MDRHRPAYRDLLERLDRWFAGGRARHPGVIPCAAGCTACCHGLFDISVADVALLRRRLADLPAGGRAPLDARARAILEKVSALEPDFRPPYAVQSIGEERFDGLCDALAGEACPCLDPQGRCAVYEDRPLICRLMGLPMATPAGRLIENCCPLLPGFPDYARLPSEPFDLERFEAEERRCLAAAARALFEDESLGGYETFVAAAIVNPIFGPGSPASA